MFQFETRWQFDVPVERVWQELVDLPNWPNWLADFKRVIVIRAADNMQSGSQYDIIYRGNLPYQFRFRLEVASLKPLHHIELNSTGDLIGRGVWRLASHPESKGCEATYLWQVKVANPLFNQLMVIPLLRSLAEQNHHATMDRAYTALVQRLQA